MTAPYRGRRAALATKHEKLAVVAPPLWSVLGLTVVSAEVDTDTLGTFSGEFPRPAGPLETARRKARLGMDAAGLTLGLASEGSVVDPWGFGVGVVDRELVVLVDDERDLSVVGRASSTEVVAFAATLGPDEVTAERIDDLLRRADLPRHHLVVRPDGVPPATTAGVGDPTWLAATTKAVGDARSLTTAIAVAAHASPTGRAHLETDLRAHLCPSRRRVIATAAADLARRLATPCPSCTSPGWGPEGGVGHRSCAWCGGPTDEAAGVRWACPTCAATAVTDAGDEPGDPGRCPRCNP